MVMMMGGEFWGIPPDCTALESLCVFTRLRRLLGSGESFDLVSVTLFPLALAPLQEPS